MRFAHLLIACAAVPIFACESVVLERVEPNVLPAGSRAAIDLFGDGFEEGIGFGLESGSLEVGLGPVELFASTQARVEVPPAAPAGLYDIVAIGPTARLPGALEIVEGEALIVFLDVGQGDSTLIIAPGGEVALIDGGPVGAREEVNAALQTYAGGRLDVAILSHHDADHLAGLVGVLSGPDNQAGTADDLNPAVVLAPNDTECDSQTCDRFRSLSAYPFTRPSPNQVFPLGDVELEVVAIDGDLGAGPVIGVTDPNERSLVIMLRFAGREVLILGDLTGGGEGTADLEGPLAQLTGAVDVLRTGHHGSRTSSSDAALQTWSPLATVLSVGTDNVYCHPAPDVLTRLSERSPRVLMTGSGILDDERCALTPELPEVKAGVGDVLLRIGRDGGLNIDGDAL